MSELEKLAARVAKLEHLMGANRPEPLDKTAEWAALLEAWEFQIGPREVRAPAILCAIPTEVAAVLGEGATSTMLARRIRSDLLGRVNHPRLAVRERFVGKHPHFTLSIKRPAPTLSITAHGLVGVGKTHLLHRIMEALKDEYQFKLDRSADPNTLEVVAMRARRLGTNEMEWMEPDMFRRLTGRG